MLRCVAVCCSVLQCVPTALSFCIHTLFITALRPYHMWLVDLICVLQCVAVCCSVLQCVAVCCSVSQCVAVCCSVSLQPFYSAYTPSLLLHTRSNTWLVDCICVLPCVAVCCSVLQCVAVCCSVSIQPIHSACMPSLLLHTCPIICGW